MQELGCPRDYDIYSFSLKEKCMYGCEGLLLAALFAYVFYRSITAFVFMIPIIFIFMKKKKHDCILKRKDILSVQFKELLGSITAGLYAGYSIENAFICAYRDMVMLFGKNAFISLEVCLIARKLKNNVNLEDLLDDFGLRSHVKDVEDFAQVFRIAKRNGGDMPLMIKQTAEVISDKLEARRKINTVMSSKKLEQNIMNCIPFGIILYIDASSPGFFDVLYHNVSGVLIMTALAAVYIVAYLIAEKITEIKM